MKKIVIEINDNFYNSIKADERGYYQDTIYDIVRNGIPLSEVVQGPPKIVEKKCVEEYLFYPTGD